MADGVQMKGAIGNRVCAGAFPAAFELQLCQFTEIVLICSISDNIEVTQRDHGTVHVVLRVMWCAEGARMEPSYLCISGTVQEMWWTCLMLFWRKLMTSWDQ